jgi:hypothetical protein
LERNSSKCILSDGKRENIFHKFTVGFTFVTAYFFDEPQMAEKAEKTLKKPQWIMF